ncbi:MAG: helix-turn-helix domain-containing protein [Lachnospiraceae bacterium]|nr:helix-turn-helix domain-containing protein [Lachnospiraceae bacterium]
MRKKGKRNLNYEDRKRIEAMTMQGIRVVEIAESVGVHRATIYNELKRSGTPYRADEAQKTIYGR